MGILISLVLRPVTRALWNSLCTAMSQCEQLVSSHWKTVCMEGRQAVFAPVVMDIDVPSLHVFAEAVDSSLFLSKKTVPFVENRTVISNSAAYAGGAGPWNAEHHM